MSEPSTKVPSRGSRFVQWLSLGDRPTAIGMAVLVFYYVITWGPWQGKASGDGWFGFLYLKTIFYFHTLDMRYAAPEFLRFFGEDGPGHHMPNRCPFGPVFIWMPFYALVAIPEWILRAVHVWKGDQIAFRVFGQTVRYAYGQSPIHVWVAGLGTLFSVLLGWRQTLKLFMRHVPVDAARVGAAATIFATPLLWYTAHQSFYQHGIAFLCIATFFEYWERTYGETSPRRFVLIGLLLGYATMVRAQEVIYVLPFAVEIILGVVRGPRRARWIVDGIIAALCFTIAFAPQALVWRYYSGKIAPIQAEPIRLREAWPLVVLFSTRAGLFCWTPIAFIGLYGVLKNVAKPGPTGRLLRYFSFAFAIVFYIVCCAWVVAGAFAFGARRLSDAMGLVGLGIALLLANASPLNRKRLVRVVIACVVLNLVLMETLRARLIQSPGSTTRSLAGELQRAHAPEPVVNFAAHVGWPFCEPAALMWSLVHRLPIATFETVVGELVLERDGQWLTTINHGVVLDRANRYHVGSGMTWPDKDGGVVVDHNVRIPMSNFATEPERIEVVGTIKEGAASATFNGQAVELKRIANRLRIDRVQAHAGYNELVLDVPIGSRLDKLDIEPLEAVKRPRFPRLGPHQRNRPRVRASSPRSRR